MVEATVVSTLGRRLPVLDEASKVLAILSLDYIAVAAHDSAEDESDVTWAQVGAALKAISEHPMLARLT